MFIRRKEYNKLQREINNLKSYIKSSVGFPEINSTTYPIKKVKLVKKFTKDQLDKYNNEDIQDIMTSDFCDYIKNQKLLKISKYDSINPDEVLYSAVIRIVEDN